jgi:hypothetical protein
MYSSRETFLRIAHFYAHRPNTGTIQIYVLHGVVALDVGQELGTVFERLDPDSEFTNYR